MPIKEVWADSDGYRNLTVYVGLKPPGELDQLAKNMALAMAKKLQLTVIVRTPQGWAQVVWMDEEYISVDYRPNGFYWIYKRAELGLCREPSSVTP